MKDFPRAKIFCATLAVLMFSMILTPVVSAAIGVEEGDWAKYKVEAEIPEIMEAMKEIEEMEWAKFTVESVSDTTVTAEGTVHYKNGTEETEPMEDVLESGWIIEADLGEGDEVMAPFFGAEMTLYINGTVSRTYAGASREVNYVEITTEEYTMTWTRKAYWDKAKGVLCEMSMSMSGEYEGETVEMSMSYKMTETNLWEAAPTALLGQWLWILVVVIIIVAVVVAGSAVLLLRRRKVPLPEVAPAPTE